MPALAGAVVVVTGAMGMALAAPDDPPEPPAVGQAPTERGAPDEQRTEPGDEPASERGQERRAAARQFVAAKQEWLDCVAQARAARAEPGPLDREEACGEKPRPVPAASRPGGGHGADARPDHARGRGHGRLQAPGQLKKDAARNGEDRSGKP